MPVQSQALEANLQRTAVEVVIPEEHKLLLTITEPLYGIQQETEKLLNEINHTFIGWTQTLEDLHYRAMGDFFHYNEAERGAEGLAIFCRVYRRAAHEATPEDLREVAIRYWLYYLDKIISESGEKLERNLPAVGLSVASLEQIFCEQPLAGITASPRLRRLAKALRTAGEPATPLLDRTLVLYSRVLESTYTGWLELDDPLTWFEACAPGAPLPDPMPRALKRISHDNLRACLHTLGACAATSLEERAQELLDLPENGQIVRSYVDAATCVRSAEHEDWENLLSRIGWMSRVLGTPELATVHEAALHEISRSYTDVLHGGDREQLKHFVRETFATLRRTEFEHPEPVLDLIKTIGTEVMKTGDENWIEAIIDELVDFDFQSPRFSGFTADWQVKVNPAHLKNIRTYLALVKEAPPLARKLLAALIVHLKIGGIFIADTDLFQKDVSELLNSDIRWTYDLINQLCKLFPVYFNDIGAEGELRDTSTRLDELRQRKDALCHFLRKQCHVESNPQLMGFIEAAVYYWATTDKRPLAGLVPQSLYASLDAHDPLHEGLHQVFSGLATQEAEGGEINPTHIHAILQLDRETLGQRIADLSTEADPKEIEKAELVVRTRQLIGRKYEINHTNVIERLREFHHIDSHHVDALQRALDRGRNREALALLLEILERLKKIILSPEPTQAIEDIYYKRHVAVGIPSMYGRYREEKFEAMGLTFRVQSLADVLFERMIASQNLGYITKSTLHKVAVWMRMLLRALRIEGYRGRGLEIRIWMLEQALQSRGLITVDQYINIFQLLSNSIRAVVRNRFLDTYEPLLGSLVERMAKNGKLPNLTAANIPGSPEGEDAKASVLRYGEAFLRDLMAQTFGLQRLDNLVGTIIQTLSEEREKLDVDTLNLLMTYDVDGCFVGIEEEGGAYNGHIYVGNKGFMLKRLARYGFPVPRGFILTTEVFRCRRAIEAYKELRTEHVNRIVKKIGRLERLTGARYADPSNPLLLSVRSGAAISMPGMLDSFLNVGMNVEITEGFAQKSGAHWAAWDAYRRFLQFWGMSFGINRDQFDHLMQEAKVTFSVEKKSQLVPDQMRALAMRYRQLVQDHRVKIIDDPWEQLHRCIDLVLDSWNSEKARVYRRALQIAEEWGTAVIVQQMVYGNLNNKSGTGVVLTRHPWHVAEEVELYGDFVLQGQGDDVVSGLVQTYPISEEQRLKEEHASSISFEKDFPDLYEALAVRARSLIREVGMMHQEIEFTFENDQPEGLYVLQSRDIVLSETTSVATFVPCEALDAAKAAQGIGVGGGAISGRVAYTNADIATLRRSHKDDKIILIRPDTVPDDIHLVLQANGLLTCIGGATSHAAVASQRIGVSCVVGCRALDVDESQGSSTIGGHIVRPGDFISINGQDGSVYLGEHEIVTVRT
ncbi:MAG: hypothetical protein JRH20_00415 [Deltaproteobacteria bacterium]|nr:hypothetical protein [Deltaproteobacteria bacterium]